MYLIPLRPFHTTLRNIKGQLGPWTFGPESLGLLGYSENKI